MSHFVRLALLSVLVFVAMSAYLLIPTTEDFWQAAAQKEVVHAELAPRVSIFLTDPGLDEEPTGNRDGEGEKVRPSLPSDDRERYQTPGPLQQEAPGSLPPPSNPVRPPAASPSGKRPARTYAVKKGDTLSEIAARLLGSVRFVDDLLKANPSLGDRNHLQVGQILVLPAEVSGGSGADADRQPVAQPLPAGRSKPAPSVVETRAVGVKRGDTLYGFAERYLGDGAKWPQLLALNRDRIGPDAKLVPGTMILIPATAGDR